MISLTSVNFDTAGDFILDFDEVKSKIDLTSRRVSRTATLDGGALFVDNGYSPSDATFSIVLSNSTQDLRDSLNRLVQLHSQLLICFRDGAFTGTISNIAEKNVITLTFLVNQQVN